MDVKITDVNLAFTKAGRYCAYQERSQQEVRDKLYEWGLWPEAIENIIVDLIAEGYINEERFANVEKLKISCPSCHVPFEFNGIVKETPDSTSSLLSPQMNCSSCSSPLSVTCLYYSTVLSLQRASDRYNSFWMKCDEVGCQIETERLGVYDRRCPADGCKGILRPIHPYPLPPLPLFYRNNFFPSPIKIDPS